MARHLGMCQELAELAMGLAKAAAEHAHRQFAAAATEPPEPPTKPAPAAKTPDSVLTFARLSRVVRQSIALEARLAAPAHPTRAHQTRPPPDPRRAPVRAALAISLANHPDRTELTADTNELLEHTLAADPDRKLSLEAILITVADDFGITLDFAHMSNELLEVLSDHADPDPPEEGSGSF